LTLVKADSGERPTLDGMSPDGSHPGSIDVLVPGIVRVRAVIAVLIAANLLGLIAIIALSAR